MNLNYTVGVSPPNDIRDKGVCLPLSTLGVSRSWWIETESWFGTLMAIVHVDGLAGDRSDGPPPIWGLH
jgi:hypothetical protein